jgi:hypothetical protein
MVVPLARKFEESGGEKANSSWRIRDDQKSMQQYLDRASASQPNPFVSDAPCALGENARGRKMVAKQEILKEEMRTSTARFNAPLFLLLLTAVLRKHSSTGAR